VNTQALRIGDFPLGTNIDKNGDSHEQASGLVSRLRYEEIFRDPATVPHRMQLVPTAMGDIVFVNDSRATNINATWYSLESMARPIIWIAAGAGLHMSPRDYGILVPMVSRKVRAMVYLGADTITFHKAFSRHVDAIGACNSMADAVAMAYAFARPGDVILFSPSRPSFDRYRDFEDRGNAFVHEVALFQNVGDWIRRSPR